MSLFAGSKVKEQSEIPNSQYIKTENEPVQDGTAPETKPITPTLPEATK